MGGSYFPVVHENHHFGTWILRVGAVHRIIADIQRVHVQILGEAGLDDKKLGEMDFRIRPITKIGLSEGYGNGTILLMAVELG